MSVSISQQQRIVSQAFGSAVDASVQISDLLHRDDVANQADDQMIGNDA